MMPPLLLSTKKLSLSQKELLLNAGFRLLEYDAITIEFLNFNVPEVIENAIYTSQNAVRSFLQNKTSKSKLLNCFCVGEKTKALLEENGKKVVETSSNSADLGYFIVKLAKNEAFYYFCGSRRRDELPNLLKTNKIEFFEVKTYETSLKPKHFGQKIDGIMFFSPSGVESFMMKNSMQDSIAFCIGETTADEAKKHTNKVVVANSPTVESVIAKAAKILYTEKNK